MDKPLLQVKGLTVSFKQDKVVDDISVDVSPGAPFALVGESGSG
jgi:ABC-type glutathione transport system ATPase component